MHVGEGSIFAGIKEFEYQHSQYLKSKRNYTPVAKTQVTNSKEREKASFFFKTVSKEERGRAMKKEATAN